MFAGKIFVQRGVRQIRQLVPHRMIGAAQNIRKNIGDLLGRQRAGEQLLGLIRSAEQVRPAGKVSGELLDKLLDRRSRDRTERGGGLRHLPQLERVHVLQHAAGGWRTHRSRSAATRSTPCSLRAPPPVLDTARTVIDDSWLFGCRAADNFRQRHTEARAVFLNDDNLAARHDAAIDDDVDGIADALVERHDSAAAKFHQIGNRHRHRADHAM